MNVNRIMPTNCIHPFSYYLFQTKEHISRRYFKHEKMTVCSCHVTYEFQSVSTLYCYLNVKELFVLSRRKIWSLSDCNWTWTQNHLVHKQITFGQTGHLAISNWPNGWVCVYELSGSGFKSSCSHLWENDYKYNKTLESWLDKLKKHYRFHYLSKI